MVDSLILSNIILDISTGVKAIPDTSTLLGSQTQRAVEIRVNAF